MTGAEECSTEAARRQGAELRLYMLSTLRRQAIEVAAGEINQKTRQLLRLLPTWWWPLLLLCLLVPRSFLGFGRARNLPGPVQ